MKSNICVVCLNNDFGKDVARKFSDVTEMYFADVAELIKFDLLDIDKAIEVCGLDYVKKIERNKVKNVVTYDNTCLCMDYTLLNDDENLKAIKENCVIVCIDLSLATYKQTLPNDIHNIYENKLNLSMFSTRKKIIKGYSDIIVTYKPGDNVLSKLSNKLVEYYKQK